MDWSRWAGYCICKQKYREYKIDDEIIENLVSLSERDDWFRLAANLLKATSAVLRARQLQLILKFEENLNSDTSNKCLVVKDTNAVITVSGKRKRSTAERSMRNRIIAEYNEYMNDRTWNRHYTAHVGEIIRDCCPADCEEFFPIAKHNAQVWETKLKVSTHLDFWTFYVGFSYHCEAEVIKRWIYQRPLK